MIRYNSKGEYNTVYHIDCNGIISQKMCNILKEWSDLSNRNFHHSDI